MTTAALDRSAGALLRQWREHRRLSQMELSLRADISTRHLSFVETGRSVPSRDMVLLLADTLELPLRDRNQLLLAAGYAPVYSQDALDSPRLAAVRTAVRQVLTGHNPLPAVAVDRSWNLVEANESLLAQLDGVAADLLEPPVNVLRVSLHPRGMASRIVNLGEWRAHLLSRLRRQIVITADESLAELHDELAGYPCAEAEPVVDSADVVVPLRLRHGGVELALISTVTTFGTPMDVTVAELAIESFFPADAATAAALRG
ncbi:DNA-binding transcriptional regulator, XRE-family HTH domain [Actinokineospora alba]|uniref:DNA-binding transcriptional regulator, XRE-family HTH domain n=1 Tax=Actinokineospora alba TaxID=504798 RepID=A0A1H0UXI9_9PSEU|nr:helix-turn-helix transcriptional regulator [Actinokineospora alba]TDP69011.1 DNA-binding XRE family transcriptional regulator [Actinokineospora alba]SDI77523.1 DNA-binding transcriptional regulator, XRE-family HTH domain [Actinokineospora alba]SDP70556.1 DNA-binding transcriptional regulator, XRE-family HTH domain [Actinokineospora alba]